MDSSIDVSHVTTDHVAVFSDFPGVQTTVFKYSLNQYLTMRAAHLTALLQLLCTGSERCSDTTREDAAWLASSLAEEISQMLPAALNAEPASSPDLPASAT